ncbi:MAG: hypothetical protein LCH54_15500 [Bacteroidetes bacterium]|nr:hypothetical protein [Bacteroidota bacterium]
MKKFEIEMKVADLTMGITVDTDSRTVTKTANGQVVELLQVTDPAEWDAFISVIEKLAVAVEIKPIGQE